MSILLMQRTDKRTASSGSALIKMEQCCRFSLLRALAKSGAFSLLFIPEQWQNLQLNSDRGNFSGGS